MGRGLGAFDTAQSVFDLNQGKKLGKRKVAGAGRRGGNSVSSAQQLFVCDLSTGLYGSKAPEFGNLHLLSSYRSVTGRILKYEERAKGVCQGVAAEGC